MRLSVVDPARWALRAYAATTGLIVTTGALALVSAVPVLSLVSPPRLALPPPREAELGVVWSSLAVSPADLQERALAALSDLLLAVAVAALAVSVLTVCILSAARRSARRPDIGLRRAVGASRTQLLAAGLLEGVAAALPALATGVAGGLAGAHLAASAWPGAVVRDTIAPVVVALAAVAGAIVIGFLVAGLPRARGGQVAPQGARPHGLALPTVQLGFSLAVLIAAGQLRKHADAVMGDRAAVPAAAGEIVEIAMPAAPPQERAARFASLLCGLGGDFDVVSLTSPGALSGHGTVDLVTTDCGRCAQGGIATPWRTVRATVSVVSADTFRAMDVALLAGRGIGPGDDWASHRVVVVSRSLAAWHFEDGQAVGRRMIVGRGPDDGWYTVVGVVEDRRGRGLGGGLRPAYAAYLSALQRPPRAADILVRPSAAGTSAAIEGAVRESLGTTAFIERRVAESRRAADEADPVRWFAAVVRFEGVLALVIAALGMFAAMHLWVEALRAELGVRRAVGARRRAILGFVLLRAAAVVVVGVAFALWVGELVSGTLASTFAGLPARTVGVVLPPALVLLAAAFAGALVPAWRASRTAPARLAEG